MPKATAGTARVVKWTRRKLCTTPYTRNSLCNPVVALAYVLVFRERWHIFGAGHSRTLRHDWHGYPSLQWYDLSQDVPSMDSDIWVAFVLFYALGNLYSSP